MKETGYVRRLDDLGRIQIPKDLRKELGILLGQSMDIFVTENGNVLLKKKFVEDDCLY